MLPRLAEAVEKLFGGSLSQAAGFARGLATITLVVAVTLPLLRAAFSFIAFRYGWEEASVVRCPRCRRLVADPESPVCPSGHPVRFPPWAAVRESYRRRWHGLRRAVAGYRFLLPAAVAVVAALAFSGFGVARMEGPLAGLCASIAYLFFVAALALAALAASLGRRGAPERILLTTIAAGSLLPAIALGLLAGAFEPPRPREIGSVWTTPTALYLSTGGRARRVGGPGTEVEALLVEARAPAFGVVWQGLEALRVGGRVIRWRGRGGFTARVLSRWANPLSRRGVFLARSSLTVRLAPNEKVWIVSEPGRIRLSTAGSFDLRPAPPAPLRRTG
jgi:hypothetical protein